MRVDSVASSDPGGLKGFVHVRANLVDNFTVSISADDIIFSSQNPGQTMTTATLRMNLSGNGEDNNPRGNYAVTATLAFDGLQDQVVFVKPAVSVNQVVSVTTTVPVGTPLTFSASMVMGVNAPLLEQEGNLDFDESFDFVLDEVFLLEPGVTVNSASWGLVDNQLPAAIPVPMLSGPGVLLLVAVLLSLGAATTARFRVARTRTRA